VELLIDLFGYLSIIVHGLTILAPIDGSRRRAVPGPAGAAAVARGWHRRAAPNRQAGGLERRGPRRGRATTVALETAVLVGTVDISLFTA